MKNRIWISVVLFTCSLVNVSCNDWLDVTPQAQVNADKLFATPRGYENALYGIYTSMTDQNSYGMHMTYGLMDVLAQYYSCVYDNSHAMYEAAQYNYKAGSTKDYIAAVWLKSYNSIANCNVLLEYLKGKSPDFFEGDRYVLIYAETLALRAYLHFDLLRAFAPSWAQDPDALCLPYADNFTDRVHKQKKTREIVELLLKDLEEARKMLKPVDQALQDKFKEMYYHYQSDPDEEFISFRAYRLNYWAITGLMARIYHYMGDAKAYDYAREVIQAAEDGYFAFASESEVSAPLKSRDVVMKNEVLFALNFPGVHDLWYKMDASYKTSYAVDDVESIYPSSDDFRGEYLVITNNDGDDVSVKYADVKSEKGGKVPMIRLSEMYLIAAESGFTRNKEEAIGYLATLRTNRGIAEEISNNITYDNFVKELTIEARREFLGEGQLFYWYKRLGAPVYRGNQTITVQPETFCLPLPAVEVEFGGRKEDYLNNL